MKIYPDNSKIDNFIIHLSRKELENLKEGISLSPHPDSPWSKHQIRIINKAIEANETYRSLKWK